MEVKPSYRSNDLLMQELKGELLIYDLKVNKAYRLNDTLAAIWQFCDGKHSVSEISAAMSRKNKTAVSEDLIWLALEQLKKDNLLENSEQIESKFEGVSRRQVIRKIGFASLIALPVLSSIVAPKAAHAQSVSAAVRCTRATNTAPFVCYETDCRLGSCSGFNCTDNLADTPEIFCCSGTRYGVQTAPPGVNVTYYCR